MNRADAQKILEHLDIVKHFAEGGELIFYSSTWDGKPIVYYPHYRENSLLISCLEHYAIPSEPLGCCPYCPKKKRGRRECHE